MEMTVEQKRALALASARARAAAAAGQGAPAAQNGAPAPSEAPVPAFQRASGNGALLAGFQDAIIKGGLGLKQFFGGLSDDDRAVLTEMKKEAEADPEGFKRTFGDVAGNIVMTMLPGVGVGKAAMLPSLARTIAARSGSVAGGIGAAAATSGATSFALTPGEGDSFGEQMADKAKSAVQDAAVGGAMSAGGKLLKKALTKPFTPTTEAQRLMDQGVVPTLQQGSEAVVGRAIGGMSSGATKVKRRQDREILESYVKQFVAPGLDTSNMTLSEINAHARHLIEADRDGIFNGKRFSLPPQVRSFILSALQGPRGTEDDVVAEALRSFPKLGRAMMSTNNVPNIGPDKMKEIRQRIQDQIDRYPSGPMQDRVRMGAKERLIEVKDRFDNLVRDVALSPDERTRLGANDQQWKYFKRLQEASQTAPSHKNLRMEHLLQQFAEKDMQQTGGRVFAEMDDPALKNLLEPAMRVIGETPNQNQWRAALTTAKRAALPVIAGAGLASGGPLALLAPAYGASLMGQTRTGARILFGDTDVQKKMAEYLRRLEPYTAPAGFSLTPED